VWIAARRLGGSRNVASQRREIWIGTAGGQDLGVAGSDRPASFALQRTDHDGGATALLSGGHDRVHEVDQVVRQPGGDLLAHTTTLPTCGSTRLSWPR